MPSFRRSSTMLTTVLLLQASVLAAPAHAVAIGSADFVVDELLADQGTSLVLQVRNGGVPAGNLPLLGAAGDSSINAIQIELPPSTFVVENVVEPAGWTPAGGEPDAYDPELGVIQLVTDGAGIAPTATLAITIEGRSVATADDVSRPVPVFVSDDGGVTLTSAGAPLLTTRILEVYRTVVFKPGAVNTDATQVTAGQDTAQIRVFAENHGTARRTVTFGAEKTGGSSSLSVSGMSRALDPGQRAGAALPVTFGAAGSLQYQGTATTDTGSVAVPLQADNLTVQQAFAATYVADSLAPQTVVQGKSYSFSIDVNKTGVQPADLTTTFDIPAIGYSSTGATGFGAGNATTEMTFASQVVPVSADSGDYATRVTATGVDHNGATVDVEITPDLVTLDNLVPFISITADVGPTTVNGATPAAGNGRNITFTGEVTVEGGAACTDCVISAQLVMLDANGNETGRAPITLNRTGSALSSTQSFTFAQGTTAAYATASAVRGGSPDLSATASSAQFEVDIIAPDFAGAITGRGDDADFVDVFITELVDASRTSSLDWSVDGNAVLVQGVATFPQPDGATRVRLTLSQRLADNATPVVSYTPVQIGLNGPARMTDRVDLPLADDAIEAVDGIVPAAPIIDAVNGLGLQEGEFWSNVGLPEVTLSGMAPGDILYLYYDLNDNGLPEDGEIVFDGPIAGESDTVTLERTLGSTDQRHRLIARMFDSVGFGGIATEFLNLDYSVPVITGFTQVGDTVTVFISESLSGRGRNAAFDWTVVATQNGETASRTVTQVAVGADSDQRVLTVSGDSFDPGLGSVTGVRYKYRGSEGGRYDDLATNILANQLASS